MLSNKINSINPSLTLELSAKINKLKKEGIKVYNFTVGEPDFKTPRYIIDKTLALNSSVKDGFILLILFDNIIAP